MTHATLKLEPKLDLRAAAELRTDLLALKGQDVSLDASEVSHVGALAVQVVRAAAKTWSETGSSLSFDLAGSDLCDQLSLLGYSPETLTTWETA